MIADFFNEIKEELNLGAKGGEHPFRYFALATVGLDRIARLRLAVLREISDDLQLVFYSDKRAKKITHINENNKVSMLFYNPEKTAQLKIEGIATINSDFKGKSKLWDALPDIAKKKYSTVLTPGSAIKDPKSIEYHLTDQYFCQIKVEPFKMEYLKLKSLERIHFSKNDNVWKGEFLVP